MILQRLLQLIPLKQIYDRKILWDQVTDVSHVYIYYIYLFVLCIYQISSFIYSIFLNVAPHFFWDTLYIPYINETMEVILDFGHYIVSVCLYFPLCTVIFIGAYNRVPKIIFKFWSFQNVSIGLS